MAFHNIPPNGFPDLPDMEELEAVVKDVNNLSDNKANQITIAPFFNPEASYEVGDLVYYNGLSYRCANDHEGEWDADDFAATTVSNELATLKSGLTTLTTDNNNDIISVFGVETDGRYYTFTFTNPFKGDRQFFVIVYGRQDGDPGIAPVMYKTNGVDTAELVTSNTNITSALNDGVLTITVDCGGNAWTRPCMWVRKEIYKEWTQV